MPVGQDGSLMRREGEGERGGGGEGNERTVGLRFVSQMTIWSY